jgi:hypothetical protein
MGRIMEQANGLITRGAEGAGDAEDPSRTIASERVLNGAIVAADISQSFEEYVEIFDHFYAEDIEGTTDAAEESVPERPRCLADSRVSFFRSTCSPRLAASPYRFSRAPCGKIARMRRTQRGRSSSVT